MHTSMHSRLGRTRPALGLVFALSIALAGCEGPCSRIGPLTAPAPGAGSLDLTTYVAAGTSLSAGWQSGGLVDRHQVRSFPAIFAHQIGKTVQLDGHGTFTLPVYDRDGFPQLFRIVSYSPLVLSNTGRATGNPTNLSQPTAYHNMAVPFAIGFDFVDTTYYYGPSAVHPDVAIAFFSNIARHRGTIAANVLSLAPTLITWEYGTNEVLGPAASGVAASPTTAEQYAPVLNASLDAIHAVLPNTEIAVFNVPDASTVPFANTLSAFTVSLSTGQPVPLVGADGPLQFGDLVLLNASSLIATGTGIPAGGYNYLNPSVPSNGSPLPENYILRGAEIAQTRTEVQEMNLLIASAAATRPYVALVDLHALYDAITTTGLVIGGTPYTSDFITGGLFSLDGIHPNDLAHAVIANALIDALNARFGASIQRVNPLDWATANASRARPALPPNRPLPVLIDGWDGLLPKPVPDYVRLR